MGGREELDVGEDAFEVADDAALPAGVEVEVEFVDEDEAGGYLQRVKAICDVIEGAYSAGDISYQTDQGALPIAHL